MSGLKTAKSNLLKMSQDYLVHKKKHLDSLVGDSAILKAHDLNFDITYGEPGPLLEKWFSYHGSHLVACLSEIKPNSINPFVSWAKKDYLKQDFNTEILKDLQVLINQLSRYYDEAYNIAKNTTFIKTSFEKVVRESGFIKERFVLEKNAPFSIKLHLAAQNIIELTDLLFNLANNHMVGDKTLIPIFQQDNNLGTYNSTAIKIGEFRTHFNQYFYPEFEGYLKYVAVHEIVSVLSDNTLSEVQQIRGVKAQLNNKDTHEILYKNNQSQTEFYLKLLSVISIFVGIGIVTTLGLVAKRLYDTSGRSANFFKPLTQDLSESASKIITDIENTSSLFPT